MCGHLITIVDLSERTNRVKPPLTHPVIIAPPEPPANVPFSIFDYQWIDLFGNDNGKWVMDIYEWMDG
jgi:hypothetical protein